jgi:hypothetical protein
MNICLIVDLAEEVGPIYPVAEVATVQHELQNR